jgi:hypothetical protein
VIGNIVLPQLCHFIPNGGVTLLPIYFFTLIAAYKYGLRVGLLTAILSPVINYFLFAMPSAGMLPLILVKSSLLALSASAAAHYCKKISLPAIIIAVLVYQFLAIIAELIFTGSIQIALNSFRTAIPGILIQMFGGYALLKSIAKI